MNTKGLLVFICSLFLFCISTQAFSACAFIQKEGNKTTATKSFTMPIINTISVPPDTPVGKEIYRQKISLSGQGPMSIKCDSAGLFYFSYKYLTTPITPPTYSNEVYNTNLPGIGIKFVSGLRSGDAFPVTYPSTNCTAASTICNWTNGFAAASWFSLIKTANNVPAGKVSASSLPSVIYSIGQAGAMVDVYKITLSGDIQITTPTCDITLASQSMTVNLGRHEMSTFNGKGATTDWKDASINLSNCGQFFGNSQGANVIATFNGDNVKVTMPYSNFVTVTLTSLNGIEDATKGIMKLDDSPNQATGIGIQLSTSEDTAGLVNLTRGFTQALPMNGVQEVTIPLYARYIQTTDRATAGLANGRLEYTIAYQ
ncbi:fimbrial protein [Phytobacter massiliensis]|uniref:fimbrial protein n=1 Tax=Phytobacter massiliensis TaxID=1485952 RepID=UPI0003177883|nr:fimbrial protein [Phytobacter massiliensis]